MVTTRSISAMPYLGGTINTSFQYNAMARLSSTRMVWFYQQTAPNWLIGAVVDTPTGWINGGTPTMTTQQLLNQGTYPYGYIQAARLNDNAVIVFSTSGSTFNYTVYEIDSNSQLNQTATGSVTPAGATIGGVAKVPTSQSFNTGYNGLFPVEVSDNNVVIVSAVSANAIQLKVNYNTTSKAVTFDAAWTLVGPVGAAGSFNIVPRKIPGTTMTLVTIKLANASNTWYYSNGFSAYVLNADGSIQMTPAQLPSVLNTGASDAMLDLIPLPGNRLATSNSNSATFWSIDYNAKTYAVISNGQFTTAWNPATLGYTMLPLTADYFLLMNRSSMVTPGANTLRCKVVRRVDFNIIEQSAASSGNTNQGFTVTGTPGTFIQTMTTEPEIINGKIFYWGFDAGAGNPYTKLSWTIITLPSS